MKVYLLIYTLFFGIAALGLADESSAPFSPPEAYASERYAPLWKKSPFTLASTQEVTVQPGFANNLALVGVARIGSESIAIILNRTTGQRTTLSSKKSNPDGFKLVEVKNLNDTSKVSVILQNGIETAEVRLDPALINATPVNRPQIPQVQRGPQNMPTAQPPINRPQIAPQNNPASQQTPQHRNLPRRRRVMIPSSPN